MFKKLIIVILSSLVLLSGCEKKYYVSDADYNSIEYSYGIAYHIDDDYQYTKLQFDLYTNYEDNKKTLYDTFTLNKEDVSNDLTISVDENDYYKPTIKVCMGDNEFEFKKLSINKKMATSKEDGTGTFEIQDGITKPVYVYKRCTSGDSDTTLEQNGRGKALADIDFDEEFQINSGKYYIVTMTFIE